MSKLYFFLFFFLYITILSQHNKFKWQKINHKKRSIPTWEEEEEGDDQGHLLRYELISVQVVHGEGKVQFLQPGVQPVGLGTLLPDHQDISHPTFGTW